MNRLASVLASVLFLAALAFGIGGCGTVNYSDGGYGDADYVFGEYGHPWPAYYNDVDVRGAYYGRPPLHRNDDRRADVDHRDHPGPAPEKKGGGRPIPSIPNHPRPAPSHGGGGSHSGDDGSKERKH